MGKKKVIQPVFGTRLHESLGKKNGSLEVSPIQEQKVVSFVEGVKFRDKISAKLQEEVQTDIQTKRFVKSINWGFSKVSGDYDYKDAQLDKVENLNSYEVVIDKLRDLVVSHGVTLNSEVSPAGVKMGRDVYTAKGFINETSDTGELVPCDVVVTFLVDVDKTRTEEKPELVKRSEDELEEKGLEPEEEERESELVPDSFEGESEEEVEEEEEKKESVRDDKKVIKEGDADYIELQIEGEFYKSVLPDLSFDDIKYEFQQEGLIKFEEELKDIIDSYLTEELKSATHRVDLTAEITNVREGRENVDAYIGFEVNGGIDIQGIELSKEALDEYSRELSTIINDYDFSDVSDVSVEVLNLRDRNMVEGRKNRRKKIVKEPKGGNVVNNNVSSSSVGIDEYEMMEEGCHGKNKKNKELKKVKKQVKEGMYSNEEDVYPLFWDKDFLLPLEELEGKGFSIVSSKFAHHRDRSFTYRDCTNLPIFYNFTAWITAKCEKRDIVNDFVFTFSFDSRRGAYNVMDLQNHLSDSINVFKGSVSCENIRTVEDLNWDIVGTIGRMITKFFDSYKVDQVQNESVDDRKRLVLADGLPALRRISNLININPMVKTALDESLKNCSYGSFDALVKEAVQKIKKM